MPIRPFPYPFRVGSDICYVPRIIDLITRGSRREPSLSYNAVALNQFLRRVFTIEERMMYRKRWRVKEHNMSNSMVMPNARHLAGRWAAKEAVIKAVKPRKLTLHEIIVFSGNKKPTDDPDEPGQTETYAIVLDRSRPVESAQETSEQELEGEYSSMMKFDKLDGQIVRLSISHDGDYAYAVCMAPTMPEPGDVGGEAAAREDEKL